MTTIFTKEIERLEEEIEEFQTKHTRQIETISPLADVTFFKIRELQGHLSTLKQAEQKHLKFVEDVKKILDKRRVQVNIAFEYTDERMLAHLHTFINKFEDELDNLSKGDELK